MDVRSCVRSESGRVGAGDPEENRNLQFSCWTLHIDGIVFRMCRRVPLRSFEVPSTRRPPTVKKSQFSTPLVQPARDTTLHRTCLRHIPIFPHRSRVTPHLPADIGHGIFHIMAGYCYQILTNQRRAGVWWVYRVQGARDSYD